MGRNKTYDRDNVAERAMHVFWDNGYYTTTARQLADATGLNVSSLYAEFGSKEGLYQAAVERYERDVVTTYIGALEEPGASLATLHKVLLQYPKFARAEGGSPGCLLCNAAIEQAPTPLASEASTARYVSRLSAGVVHVLGNAQRDGTLGPDVDIEAHSHYLVATILGLFVMVRAKTNPEILDNAVRQALTQIDAMAR